VGTLVRTGVLDGSKIKGTVLKSCVQAVNVKTSAMGMWPDRRFRDSSLHVINEKLTEDKITATKIDQQA